MNSMYTPETEIFILSPRTGYIPQLRMAGPIPTPFKVTVDLCLAMISAGVTLYEYDPKTKMTIKLTVENLYNSNKFEVTPEIEKESDVDKKDTKKVTPEPPVENNQQVIENHVDKAPLESPDSDTHVEKTPTESHKEAEPTADASTEKGTDETPIATQDTPVAHNKNKNRR